MPYPDTVPTLAALRAADVRVAVVSNIGFDIRPLFDAWGLAELVDAHVLSYEVGRCKPDPAIFWRACGMLGVDPEEALMVGDSPADAGAVAAGCAALILPAADPGRPNALGSVLDSSPPPDFRDLAVVVAGMSPSGGYFPTESARSRVVRVVSGGGAGRRGRR